MGWKLPARPLQPQSLSFPPLEPLGADAFLPALTEELIWSPDIGETQLDVEFLMELLDPDELRGEGEPPAPEPRDRQVAPWAPCLQWEGRRATCGGWGGGGLRGS